MAIPKYLQNRDAIRELEDWKGKHKNRSVEIDIDDGYGATCWRVELRGGDQYVYASEVSFMLGTPYPNVCTAPLKLDHKMAFLSSYTGYVR